jgi:hypothetical protein
MNFKSPFAAVILFFALAGAADGQEADFGARLSAAAIERTAHRVVYDPSYVRLAYPGGDVAADRGVCADVVVRAFRALGVDLQERVHEDMKTAFSAYPDHWGLLHPDSNIDLGACLILKRSLYGKAQALMSVKTRKPMRPAISLPGI